MGRRLRGPLSQLNWLQWLDVIDKQNNGKIRAHRAGSGAGAKAIHWTPESLPPDEPKPPPDPSDVSVPPLEEIVERVQAAAEEARARSSPGELIESLHLGLWANEQRHFAILAGLSGSGKTQLAMEYGRAVTGADDESSDPALRGFRRARVARPEPAPRVREPAGRQAYVGTDFLALPAERSRESQGGPRLPCWTR